MFFENPDEIFGFSIALGPIGDTVLQLDTLFGAEIAELLADELLGIVADYSFRLSDLAYEELNSCYRRLCIPVIGWQNNGFRRLSVDQH